MSEFAQSVAARESVAAQIELHEVSECVRVVDVGELPAVRVVGGAGQVEASDEFEVGLSGYSAEQVRVHVPEQRVLLRARVVRPRGDL